MPGALSEVFDEDKAFEMRMASFLDWYLFDRPSPTTGKTPARSFPPFVLIRISWVPHFMMQMENSSHTIRKTPRRTP